jgi:peptide/nickel transport system ATP-binding protein
LVDKLLEVKNLQTHFFTSGGVVKAVDGISYDVAPGETVAVVGESGCGKSVGAMSILRLIPNPPGRIVNGEILFQGRDLLKLSDAEMRDIRGRDIGMIFQEPMTSLNPVLSIGRQLTETVEHHLGVTTAQAMTRAKELLGLVGISEPDRRLKQYPHHLSGGMRQRVMIAMALACDPKVLIADDPTTALDVTIQAQILKLMVDLQERLGTAVILITHDLGVVAETAHRVIVMYAGRKVEEASVEDLFANAQHPYTHGLLASIPHLDLIRGADEDEEKERLQEIPGIVPALSNLPPGCTFAPRCRFADEKCRAEYPPFEQKRPGHWAACWHSDALYGKDGTANG